MAPALLTSDVHLSPTGGQSVSRALARLIAEHCGKNVLLVGDIFDLSLTPLDHEPAETLGRILAAHPEWVLACKTHLEKGGRLCFVPGNHDAELNESTTAGVLLRTLAPPDDRQLAVMPWFYRHGSVHIEHGHVYDPDCAPNHPLSPANAHSEGLGTALVRRFLAPSDSLEFAHAHELTPRSGLLLAAKKWGASAPVHMLEYFRTAAGLCLESLAVEGVRAAAKNAGTAALPEHAERTGLPIPVIEALLAGVPRPTHHAFKDTFLRLYFDRLVAGGAAAVGTALLPVSAFAPSLLGPSALLMALGGVYLTASSRRARLHRDGPVQALALAAERIRALTDCSLVVFGHSHVPTEGPGYVNLGSFGFAENARPYLLLDDTGRSETRRLPA
jgi:hypothetical protein